MVRSHICALDGFSVNAFNILQNMNYKMCQKIPRGYSRKRENVKVLTNSGEQRGQDQNDKNTTLKTKKQVNNMDPTKKLVVDSGAPEE